MQQWGEVLADGPSRDVRVEPEAGGHGEGGDSLARFAAWFTAARGSSCALLRLQQNGGDDDDDRGVTAAQDIAQDVELLRVPRSLLITVEMGRATPPGKAVAAALQAGRITLSGTRHCFLAVFLLWEGAHRVARGLRGGDDAPSTGDGGDASAPSFFAPYYAVLPRGLPGSPLFWGQCDLARLAGSHLAVQVAERRAAIAADWAAIAAAAPALAARATEADFVWARAVVASRNFALVLDGSRTDALVPFADMLNHRRPRQTSWGFNASLGDDGRGAFVIRSLQPLHRGEGVHDSYGVKCNSRWLLSYGFTVWPNVEAAEGGGVGAGTEYNELRLLVAMRRPEEDPWFMTKLRLLRHAPTARPVRVSTAHDADVSREALSFARFVCASGYDVARLPTGVGAEDYDWGHPGVPPLSEGCELAALRLLAAACAAQLGRYPTTLEQDLARLREDDAAAAAAAAPATADGAGGAARARLSANERNALVLVAGEKAVAAHYVALADTVAALLALPRRAGLAQIAAAHGAPGPAARRPASRYVRHVILPLVRARWPADDEGDDDEEASARASATLPTVSLLIPAPAAERAQSQLQGGAADVGSAAFGVRFLAPGGAPPAVG